MGTRRVPWIVRHPRWVAVIFLVVLVGCTYLVYGLPTWRVTELQVSGQYTLPLTELRDITLRQQQSRWLLFFRQTNLWAFDTRAFERRLRERWMFAKLEIKRSVPNGITLHVVEEQPAFVYQLNDLLIGIDRNGIASTILPVAPLGVAEVVFLAPPELKLGDVALTSSQSSFIATFVEKLRERNDEKIVMKRLTVAIAPDTTMRLTMVGDWEVIVNATGSAESQAKALLLAYDQKLKGQKIEYVDVSVPSRVYVK